MMANVKRCIDLTQAHLKFLFTSSFDIPCSLFDILLLLHPSLKQLILCFRSSCLKPLKVFKAHFRWIFLFNRPQCALYRASKNYFIQIAFFKINIHHITLRLIDAAKGTVIILQVIHAFSKSFRPDRIDDAFFKKSIHPR